MAFLLLVLLITGFCEAVDPFVSNGGMKKFNSIQEIRDYLKKNQVQQNTYDYMYETTARDTGLSASKASVPQNSAVVAPQSTQSGEESSSVTSGGYSTTNVQVKGVDEADIVKTDGKYIYIVSGNEIVIVDAYPPTNASIVSKIEVSGTPDDIYVNGDRLVLFAESNDQYYPYNILASDVIIPPYSSTGTVDAITYNIADKKKPVLINNISVDGNYYDSRRIGDIVYMITQEYIQTYNYDDILVPAVHEGKMNLTTPGVYYFDNPESEYVFHTITSFSMNTGKEIDAKTFLMGSTNTLYVSNGNMYLGYEKYQPMPILRSPIVNVDTSAIIGNSSSLSSAEDSFNSMSESEKKTVLAKLKIVPSPTVRKPEDNTEKTVIHRISIGNGTIGYGAKGEIDGILLNQFSLDEYGGNLRLATTNNQYGSDSYNNVVVLDNSMKKIGELTQIAPGEKIYSTRFIGDKLYMVTFKQMDPFFVVDLSDPKNPNVLGKLKIPGYSDYLHPYDTNHIIGIGKEAEQTSSGGYRPAGLKLALFDVTNATDPKMLYKYEIGKAGSSSPALSDHKAFLFDKEKDILAIPVHEVLEPGTKKNDYQETVWDGVYVFSVTPEKGFKLLGKVPFNPKDDTTGISYCSDDNAKRSLYINETFYALSDKSLKMSQLQKVSDVIKTISLPYTNRCYWIE